MTKTTTVQSKGRNAAGRFIVGNQAAVGRRRQALAVPEVKESQPITLESFVAMLEADEFDAYLATELSRLTRLGE